MHKRALNMCERSIRKPWKPCISQWSNVWDAAIITKCKEGEVSNAYCLSFTFPDDMEELIYDLIELLLGVRIINYKGQGEWKEYEDYNKADGGLRIREVAMYGGGEWYWKCKAFFKHGSEMYTRVNDLGWIEKLSSYKLIQCKHASDGSMFLIVNAITSSPIRQLPIITHIPHASLLYKCQ